MANAHPSGGNGPTKATKLAEAHKRLWRWGSVCCSQWTTMEFHQVDWGNGRGNRTGQEGLYSEGRVVGV